MTRVLLALLLCLAGGCVRKPAEPSREPAAAAPPPAANPLYGGDARAWPGTLGDQADTSRCRARLKLPLATMPAWTESYTSAEFSGYPPEKLLHFDGTLAVAAHSSQLKLLEAATGKELANRDVFLRDASASADQENIEELYITPTGRLLANDNVGRFYCFALPQLTTLWTYRADNAGRGGAGAIVADARAFYSSWSSRGLRNLHKLDVETGEPIWTYPMAATGSGLGVTYASDGLVLCYADPNNLRAIRGDQGVSPWTVAAPARIQLAPVDERRGLVHLVLAEESVHCRQLEDGGPAWTYDWSTLMPLEERERRNVQSGRSRVTDNPLELTYAAYCIGDDASFLALFSGHIVRLAPNGSVEWSVHLDSAVVTMLLFDNALLVAQLYVRPDIELHTESGDRRFRPSPADPFNLTRPRWNLPGFGGTSRKGEPQRGQAWTRVTALDPASGAILSTVDTQTTVLSNLCPAGDKVVFGGDLAGSPRQPRHYLTAYDWVEP